MDALKVLVRSTNLSGRLAKSSNRSPHNQSNGATTGPQIIGNDTATQENTSRKRKRKGDHGDVVSTYTLPQELDFFNQRSKDVNGQVSASPGSSKPRSSQIPSNTSVSNGKHTVLDDELSPQDCRHILKKHKLKITRLLPQQVTELIHTNDKKRKKSATEQQRSHEQKQKKRRLEVVPQPLTSFTQLGPRYHVHRQLQENLRAQGYREPTEIQLGSIPLLVEKVVEAEDGTAGDHFPRPNLLAVAPTGSGKTLAFLIPLLQNLLIQKRESGQDYRSVGPKAVILAPTKELVHQTVNEGRKLFRRTGIRISVVRKGMIIGGDLQQDVREHDSDNDMESESEDESVEVSAMKIKSDVLVSTPGTLMNVLKVEGDDVMRRFETVRYLVLDEADVLLDPLFREQTTSIWSACTFPLLHVSLWSATMGSSIEDLAIQTISRRWTQLLQPTSTPNKEPELLRIVVGLKDSAVPTIQHKLIYTATEQGKLIAMRELLRPTRRSTETPALTPPFLVFTQTIPRAIALHSELLYDIPAESGGSSRIAVLHADLSDTARERVMTRFRAGSIWVLITTDLLSRGVDFRGVNGVINYDFPNSSAAYVHRAGRTGRAGREGGICVTLYTKEDVPFIKNVANVVAMAEKQKQAAGGAVGHKGGDDGGDPMHKWLVESLPKPSKREKQMLKKRGVEARRQDGGGAKGKDGKRGGGANTRISTKSGYDRRMEHKKREMGKRPMATKVEVEMEVTGEED